jgi:ubiquinone/menaquinone biosynthesis C-methylase UbiE
MMNYDAELVRYQEVLRRAWALEPGDRVLDIGCGAGETTRATDDGVWFDSRAWLVTARRQPPAGGSS